MGQYKLRSHWLHHLNKFFVISHILTVHILLGNLLGITVGVGRHLSKMSHWDLARFASGVCYDRPTTHTYGPRSGNHNIAEQALHIAQCSYY